MYDKIKVLFDNTTYRYIIIGGIGSSSAFA